MTEPVPQPMTKWHLAILVSLLTMIGPFTIDTYLPAFESMEKDFNVSRALMTQTLGYYIAAFGASTLIWGAVADGIGRKPVILISVGGYIITSLACAIASSYEQFLLFRILQGFAIGGALIAGRAMVRDVFDTKEAQKVMAQAMMLFSISPVIAPVFGGFLHDYFGWRSIFWFLVIYGIAVFIFALIVVKESLAISDRNSIRFNQVTAVYKRTLKNPHYLRLVFIYTAIFSSFFVFIAGAPTIIFDVLSLGATDFYVLFFPSVTGIMLGAAASDRLLNHYPASTIMNAALIAMFVLAIGNLGLNAVSGISVLRVVLPLSIYAFFLSVIMPIVSVEILNCFPNNRGAASAMQSFIQMGFNGFSISVIVAALGSLLLNYTLAQLTLMSIAMVLWIIDLKSKEHN
ncbi:MAG: DHA1 family bicyclomycin/chloramphenicol resistance-like MFS transporter [Cocleimonas sp.]|jgi:DHA1 family bicyclomycin/chloramphenicol resistance-like MFS transporter